MIQANSSPDTSVGPIQHAIVFRPADMEIAEVIVQALLDNGIGSTVENLAMYASKFDNGVEETVFVDDVLCVTTTQEDAKFARFMLTQQFPGELFLESHGYCENCLQDVTELKNILEDVCPHCFVPFKREDHDYVPRLEAISKWGDKISDVVAKAALLFIFGLIAFALLSGALSLFIDL